MNIYVILNGIHYNTIHNCEHDNCDKIKFEELKSCFIFVIVSIIIQI